MNRTRKLIALMLAVLLLLATLPTAGLADSYKVETLKLNQWYRFQDYEEHRTIYKLKVSGETVLNYSWKNGHDGSLYVYRDKACEDEVTYTYIEETTGSSAFVLYSGTYYIRPYDDSERTKIKFSARKVATVNKPNYCLGKAITVKSGKKVEIAQTRKSNYTRWYRINLPKTKTITLSFTCNGYDSFSDSNFTLYDRNLNSLYCTERKGAYVTQGLQPKGTFYLRIDAFYESYLLETGKYLSFSWK